MADEETTEVATEESTEETSLDISDLFDTDAEQPETESDKGETSEETETEESEGDADKGESEEETETETEDKSEPPSDKEGESVPRQALLDERRKRQQAQEEAERLKTKYEPDQEAPDPSEDPDGYAEYVRQNVEREHWQKLANRSRERALEQHSDYEEKEKHFLSMASADPDLVKQMNEDPDPAAFAYNKAKESLDAQEKAVEERILARLKKEGKLKEDEPEKGESEASEAASVVSDLTSAAGAGKNTDKSIKESENPEDVFGDDLKY